MSEEPKDPEVVGRGAPPPAPNQELVPTGKQGFGSLETTDGYETSSSALAAQAAAQVQARYVMAERHPRDLDAFRQALLKECARSTFAEIAEYKKPIGDGSVRGPSIRFVETAVRCFKNVLVETPARYDSPRQRIVTVRVTDLEANLTFEQDVTIEKTVERRAPRPAFPGDLGYISTRKNTNGQNVYIVLATDDEILNKTGALISKALRTQGLRTLPGDAVAEAIAKCKSTLADRTKRDPDGERKKLIDAFGRLNVSVDALKVYLGKELSVLSPAEIDELRVAWTSIDQGETTWADLMEAKAKKDSPASTAASKSKAAAIVDKIKPPTGVPAAPAAAPQTEKGPEPGK